MTRLPLALLLLLAGCPKPKPPPALTDPAAIDLEVLDRWMAELVPLVEQAAGRSFDHVPPVRMGTASELERILESEARLILKRMYRDAPDYVIDGMAEDSRGSAPGVVGKYGIETKALYLSPEAVAGIVVGTGLEPEQMEGAAKLVLAHELAHALQDQVADLLPSFGRQRDADALEAFSAVTEGHANFVEERVAEALGLQDVRHKLDESQGWHDDTGPESPGAFSIWFRYGLGKHFVEYHYDQGGHDQVWELLHRPPATTTMLFRPETYASYYDLPIDYDPVLDGIEEELTAGAWTTVTTVLGERDLREEGQAYDPELLDEALSHVTFGYALQAFRDDRSAEVRILDFDDEEGPRRYLKLVTDHVEKMKDEPTGGLGLVLTAEPWTRLEGVEGIEHVVGMAGNVSMEQRAVWLPRGRRLVVVQVKGFRPGLRLTSAVRVLLERLEE